MKFGQQFEIIELYAGLGKIDYNRYSIAIFLTFFQSNTPDPLLFGMSIEYAVFFSFFQVKTIFDFFFRKLCNSKRANTPKRIINYLYKRSCISDTVE